MCVRKITQNYDYIKIGKTSAITAGKDSNNVIITNNSIDLGHFTGEPLKELPIVVSGSDFASSSDKKFYLHIVTDDMIDSNGIKVTVTPVYEAVVPIRESNVKITQGISDSFNALFGTAVDTSRWLSYSQRLHTAHSIDMDINVTGTDNELVSSSHRDRINSMMNATRSNFNLTFKGTTT